MDAIEELLKIMRRQGAKKNPVGLKIGTIEDSKKLRVGDNRFNTDDYLKNTDITLKDGDTVLCYRVDDDYIIICKIE